MNPYSPEWPSAEIPVINEEDDAPAEHTMIDSGLMAEFMAAHPEDAPAQQAASPSSPSAA